MALLPDLSIARSFPLSLSLLAALPQASGTATSIIVVVIDPLRGVLGRHKVHARPLWARHPAVGGRPPDAGSLLLSSLLNSLPHPSGPSLPRVSHLHRSWTSELSRTKTLSDSRMATP